MIFFLFSFLISNQFYQVDTIINSFLASFVSWTTNIMNYFFPWIPDLLQSQTLHLIILGLCCLTVCPQPYCVFILWTFLKTKLSLPDYFLLNIFGWNDAWVMIFSFCGYHIWSHVTYTCPSLAMGWLDCSAIFSCLAPYGIRESTRRSGSQKEIPKGIEKW